MNWKRTFLYALPLAATLTASTAIAQDNATVTEYVPSEKLEDLKEEKKQGFDGKLSASATLNLVSNDNVVGQTDGVSTLVGLGLVAGLDYVHKKHVIRNTLKLSEAFARTPVLPEFIKSDDLLDLEALYSYYVLEWFGFFGRLNMETALFKSQQVTADPTVYEITDAEGNVETVTTERLPLADSLQPFTLNQSIGVFAEPIQKTAFNLSTRLGFGFRETWAQDVYVITDDETTAALVEVTDISNPNSGLTIFQGGLEAFVGVTGAFKADRVFYELGGTVLVPFINNDPQDRSAGELTRIGIAANVGFAVFDWMSINYKLRAIRDPQLLEGFQLQNNLLLTFNYTFIERDAGPPPPPSEDAIRADEAEKRAAEAEARAAELEKRLADTPPVPPAPPAPEPTPEPSPEPQP